MKKFYKKPFVFTEKTYETYALACAKFPVPFVGSHHLTSAYDTFNGHTGTWLGSYPTYFTVTANTTTGIGYGTGCTSAYFDYSTSCVGIVTFS
jgi:hypothetical protein